MSIALKAHMSHLGFDGAHRVCVPGGLYSGLYSPVDVRRWLSDYLISRLK